MTRTNVVLDDKLIEECQKATGISTRRALIDHALRELVRTAVYIGPTERALALGCRPLFDDGDPSSVAVNR